MRLIPLLCLALYPMAFTDTALAQVGAVTTRSLEWLVARADAVVVATVSEVQRDRSDDQSEWVSITLAVQETIKGPEPATITFADRVSRGYEVYEGWRDAEVAHLWFLVRNPKYSVNGAASITERYPFEPLDSGWHVIRLAPSVPAERGWKGHRSSVFTIDLNVLDEPDDILGAARRAADFEGPQGKQVVSHSIELHHGLMARAEPPGDVNFLTVPIDARLEPMAHRMIRAPGSMPPPAPLGEGRAGGAPDRWLDSSLNLFRHEGAKALRHFQSPENAELLKSLLDDPAYWHHNGPRLAQPAFREYYIRKQAFEILTEWGVEAPEPVGAEPLIDPAQAPSAAAVAVVHGPTMELTSSDLLIELGGDGTPELLRLFVNPHRGLKLPRDLDEFREAGALVQGFTLFTWAEGEPVLVFHAANEFDGFSLKLEEVESRPMLISEGGRDHMQYAWGRRELWDSGIEIWSAQWRSVKDEPETWQEGWQDFPLIRSPRSK